MVLKKIAILSFFSLIFCGLMLPSDGNHGVLSPKSLTFLISFITWFIYILASQRYSTSQLFILTSSSLCCACLFLWLQIGIFYGETPWNSQLDQFKIFLITLIVVSLALFYLHAGIVTPQKIIKSAIYANFAYSCLKIAVAFLHLFGIVDILTFMQTTGFRLMSMDIHGGVIRLQTSVDIITPFLLLFVLQYRNLNLALSNSFALLYTIVAILAVLLSFSRYLIFISFIALFLHWLTLSHKRQIIGIFSASLLLGLASLAIGGDALYKIVERRFFSPDNYYSDRTRIDQIDALEAEASLYPLLGKGIGASAPCCIRDHHLPYSYEVQWIAFAMQLGILGSCILFIAFASLGWRYILPPHTLSKAIFGSLYVLWLLSGFTNPYLISLTSGIVYTLFTSAALCLNNSSKLLKIDFKYIP